MSVQCNTVTSHKARRSPHNGLLQAWAGKRRLHQIRTDTALQNMTLVALSSVIACTPYGACLQRQTLSL
eukprot:5724042-Amphidinium_carterae.1